MLTAILTNHIWSTRKADALNGLKLMQAEIIGGGTESGKKIIVVDIISAGIGDRVIITSDNPRFEEPQEIINDMLAGLTKQQMKKVLSIVDRREAIRTACMMAEKGDVILIAGKGHEDYQDVKGVKHHFDDKEEVSKMFE